MFRPIWPSSGVNIFFSTAAIVCVPSMLTYVCNMRAKPRSFSVYNETIFMLNLNDTFTFNALKYSICTHTSNHILIYVCNGSKMREQKKVKLSQCLISYVLCQEDRCVSKL
jgi:hypothetical protein